MFKGDLGSGDNALLFVSSLQHFPSLWLTDAHHIHSVRRAGVLEIMQSVRRLFLKGKE